MELFGGKWKSRVICVLHERKVLRYSSIRKEMVNISDAVLGATRKELIREANENTLLQCQKCDYNRGRGPESA